MVKNSHYFNCLYRSYNYDYNTLLDKTTYAFSLFVDRHPEIRYFDNLTMLIKGYISESNDPCVREELLKCIKKQLKYLSDSDIIENYILNEFIDLVNNKYNLGLETVKIESEGEGILNINFLLGGDEEKIDLDYVKRFI